MLVVSLGMFCRLNRKFNKQIYMLYKGIVLSRFVRFLKFNNTV